MSSGFVSIGTAYKYTHNHSDRTQDAVARAFCFLSPCAGATEHRREVKYDWTVTRCMELLTGQIKRFTISSNST